MTDDERLMKAWVLECTAHMAESVERLTEVTRLYAMRRKAEGATEDETEQMRVAFCEALSCRVLDLASRVAFSVRNDETIGGVVGHFSDHLIAIDREQASKSSLTGFLHELFDHLENEVTHADAKRHSEGN